MRYVIAGAAAVIAAGGITVALWPAGTSPSPAACKTAMAKAYASAAAAGPAGTPASEPASCHGVPTSVISRFATQIMDGH